MATIEHCIFCFETLHAELTHRKALTLEEVQKSYGEYLAQKTGGDKPKQLPALRRLAEDATSSVSSSGGSSASTSTTSLSNGSAASAASSATSVSMIDAPDVPSETPLFVTWNTVEDSVQDLDLAGGDEDEDGTEHVLRGCIGTFDTVPLEEGLSTYALTAALEDTRFHPISRRELRSLEVAVTLLTDFETARGGPEDWELGKHGLRISFVVNGFQYGSTYLPDVAVEQGWTKEQTVLNLMRKAGWSGRRDSWRKVNLRIVRYQGRKKSLTYRKFMAWREWADAQAATAATAMTAAAK
ncbi:hypothetical protein SEUCBS140593_003054 [Sporothrix eucalyptigena]|uniref:AMMECR1 domain-containing protein n=1 Tax=Sporothrix eucalyptigena TaxID=1812306 RepID=A0ABP0BBK8_9PEZI